jgi:DNA-binding NarL/FixJ family response regulator
VLKSEAAEELQHALAAVMRGEVFISPAFGEQVIANLWNRSKEVSNETLELTGRQREILQLIVEGRVNKEVADCLQVSLKTVEFHRARLMHKLGARTAAELAKVALQRGLITE